MPGRTTSNKRQREQQRKERQAEKVSKRDERRTRRQTGTDGEAPVPTELETVTDAPVQDAPALVAAAPPSAE